MSDKMDGPLRERKTMEDISGKTPRRLAIYQLSDGIEKHVYSDGSKITCYPNGNKEFRLPNGRIVYFNAKEGTSVACSGPRIFHPIKIKMKIIQCHVTRTFRGY